MEEDCYVIKYERKFCPSLPMYHVIIGMEPCTRWQWVPKTICLYEAVIGTHASAGNIASAIACKELYLASRNAYSSKLFSTFFQL